MAFLKSLLKKHWGKILSTLLGILIAILISVILHYVFEEKREPVFRPYELRSQIIDADNLNDAPLKVLDKDDKPITGDIAAVTFFFWNEGKLPIKPEHILTPLKVKLGDKNARILDVKILAQSRPLIDAKLTPDPADPRSLDLNFRILEQDDGIAAQVIYEGDPDAKIYPTGDIEGVTDLTGSQDVQSSVFWTKTVHWVILIILIVLTLAIFLAGRYIFKRANTWLDSPTRPKQIAAWIIGLAFIVLMIFCFWWGTQPMRKMIDQNSRGLATPPPNSIIPKTLEKK